MEEELRNIDVIRERMGISYREAKEVLDECGGDLVEALIKAEEKKDYRWSDKFIEAGEGLVAQAKVYIDKGNKTSIKLKRGDKTIVKFPATVGALGIVAALASAPVAIAAGIGAVAAVANKVSMEIEKPDGDTKVISMDKHREQ